MKTVASLFTHSETKRHRTHLSFPLFMFPLCEYSLSLPLLRLVTTCAEWSPHLNCLVFFVAFPPPTGPLTGSSFRFSVFLLLSHVCASNYLSLLLCVCVCVCWVECAGELIHSQPVNCLLVAITLFLSFSLSSSCVVFFQAWMNFNSSTLMMKRSHNVTLTFRVRVCFYPLAVFFSLPSRRIRLLLLFFSWVEWQKFKESLTE